MLCKSSTLVYGDSGDGKTEQAGSWAQWVAKTTGKKVRYYTAEAGGTDTVAHLINAGLIDVWELTSRPDFGETLEFASQGYWPDASGKPVAPSAKTWEEIGGLIFEGGTSFGECTMEELRGKAAKNEIIGAEKPPQQYTSGSLRIAGSGMSHYGMAQSRVRRAMLASQVFPVHLLWTCREVKAADDEMISGYKEIFGPQIVGQAMTPHIPSWFGRTIHLDTIKQQILDPATKKQVERPVKMAFFKAHFYEGNKAPYVANPRLPSIVVDELPESVIANNLTMVWLFDKIEELKQKAKELLKK